MTMRRRCDVPSNTGLLPEAPLPGRGVAAWRHGAEARGLDDAALLSSLGRHLQDAGLTFDRLVFHITTLHPEIFARILAWTPNEPVEIFERDHPATVSAGFAGSPFRQAAALHGKFAARMVDPQFLGRAAGPLLQSRGTGEIVSAPFTCRHGPPMIASFCVARPKVFGAADHLIIDSMIAPLAAAKLRPAIHQPAA